MYDTLTRPDQSPDPRQLVPHALVRSLIANGLTSRYSLSSSSGITPTALGRVRLRDGVIMETQAVPERAVPVKTSRQLGREGPDGRS